MLLEFLQRRLSVLIRYNIQVDLAIEKITGATHLIFEPSEAELNSRVPSILVKSLGTLSKSMGVGGDETRSRVFPNRFWLCGTVMARDRECFGIELDIVSCGLRTLGISKSFN